MKNGMKKTMILGVIALFVSVSISPMIAAMKTSSEEKFVVEYAMINTDGSISEETMLLNSEELSLLQGKLSTFLDLLKSTTDKTTLLNLLLNYLAGDNYPLLSSIIKYFLSSELIGSRQFVISEGWGYNLNPFKKMSTDIMKPVSFWRYGESSDILPIPSSTVVLKLSPFEVKTYTGSQLGLMFRFRGIYVNIPQQMPNQSFTFFLGSAKNVFGTEVPTITLP